MAGRVLPIALAAVAGVSIGVATFGTEFKELRKKKLEEDYKRYVKLRYILKRAKRLMQFGSDTGAVSAMNSHGPSPMASSAIPSPSVEQLRAEKAHTKETQSSASWSNMLGLWAWKKDATRNSTSAMESQGAASLGSQNDPGKP